MKFVTGVVALLSLLASFMSHAQPLELELTDIQGKQHKLSDYRGKWIVLNYWATWCPPCLEEIPELVLFHENHKDSDAVVIGVDMERLKPGVLETFVEDNFITYPVIPMVKGMSEPSKVTSYPTTFLIDPDGMVAVKHMGAVTADAIERFIEDYTPAHTVMR